MNDEEEDNEWRKDESMTKSLVSSDPVGSLVITVRAYGCYSASKASEKR